MYIFVNLYTKTRCVCMGITIPKNIFRTTTVRDSKYLKKSTPYPYAPQVDLKPLSNVMFKYQRMIVGIIA